MCLVYFYPSLLLRSSRHHRWFPSSQFILVKTMHWKIYLDLKKEEEEGFVWLRQIKWKQARLASHSFPKVTQQISWHWGSGEAEFGFPRSWSYLLHNTDCWTKHNKILPVRRTIQLGYPKVCVSEFLSPIDMIMIITSLSGFPLNDPYQQGLYLLIQMKNNSLDFLT